MEIRVIIAIVIALAIGFALTRKKKGQKPDVPLVWQAPVTPPTPTTPPTPVTPAPAAPPSVTPANQPVFLDRNRKSPGDPGYDPRATRPDPEFSPIEPQGTFWGEGPFDPSARYIDLLGRFHNL